MKVLKNASEVKKSSWFAVIVLAFIMGMNLLSFSGVKVAKAQEDPTPMTNTIEPIVNEAPISGDMAL